MFRQSSGFARILSQEAEQRNTRTVSVDADGREKGTVKRNAGTVPPFQPKLKIGYLCGFPVTAETEEPSPRFA